VRRTAAPRSFATPFAQIGHGARQFAWQQARSSLGLSCCRSCHTHNHAKPSSHDVKRFSAARWPWQYSPARSSTRARMVATPTTTGRAGTRSRSELFAKRPGGARTCGQGPTWREQASLAPSRRAGLVALEVADLVEVADGLIRHSKPDQEGLGAEIAIPRGYRLRPVEAVQNLAGRRPRSAVGRCSAR
jgi:hypothetical protein